MPSATTSGTPPTRDATTGRPAASVSIALTGVPSLREGRSRASKAWNHGPTSSWKPTKWVAALDPELARERLELGPVGAVADHHERQLRCPARAAGSSVRRTSWARLTAVIRPTQPTVNRSGGMPSEARSSSPCSAPCMRSESSMPRRTTANRDAGATPIATSSSRTSGLTATSASVVARERALDQPVRLLLRRAEVALQRMAVERVDDDRRARRAGEAGGDAPDRARLGGMRVEDMRALLSDQLDEPPDGADIAERRDLALQLRNRPHLDAALLGDEGHRCLALGDLAGRERRRVPARREPLGEIRDVERRAAHVEAGDHAQHADRFVGSEHGRLRYRPLRADVHCCGAAEGIVLGVAGGARVDARRLSGGGGARRPGADAARAEGRVGRADGHRDHPGIQRGDR